ncbi:Glycyl-glycine endopeptidase ALE-1 precursor [Clostridium sp. N3C]|uniref:M23 family metallopeptidase n=1 Tax=Clostridium sp. N3C TaxID=1776758 RepID=UPI00092E1C7D|nr:M23 family metallopeptidase [Clostridium sp. N3C]SCN25003.1 Glycyl-glycine endopeptidase ALE-1 precursor [Clostridium sp. N3C]
MDKKLFDKSSNFFKKEGFYVILFVCLCIVATIAALTARNNKTVTKAPLVQESAKKNTDVAKNNPEAQSTEIPNAIEVKKENEAKITVPKSGSDSTKEVVSNEKTTSTAVSKTTDYTFVKPVEGEYATTFSTGLVKCETIGTYKTNNGIEIKADLNSPVYSVLDGKVETVNNDHTELGQYVVINHQNGIKTVYANLKEDLKVKVGDTVKKGQVIGYVGKTRQSYSNEYYGDHLHFQVMNGSTYVDPAKYVKYSPLSKE